MNGQNQIYLCGQRLQEIHPTNPILPIKDVNGHGILYFDDIDKEIECALAGLFNIHYTFIQHIINV